MYQVLSDNLPLYDLRDDDLVLKSPKVSLKDNNAGSFEFTILPTHPYYDNIQKMKSVIQVMDDENEIFCGRVIEESVDFYNRKKVLCEGELAFFNDSIQRPAVYHDMTVRGYLETLINIHNQQVESQGIDKTFKIGAVTVTDSNDSLYKYTNWESTLQVIKTDLLDTYGGHLRIRKENGIRYLDYLEDYPNTNTQVIEFGQNLLDFTKDIDASDIATAIIPLGARLEESSIEGLEERLTIELVNGGMDFVCSDPAVNTYGWVFKTVTFDDVNVPANLKTKGEQYLNDIQFENVTLTVQAVDLHMLNVDIERIKMLDEIKVISKPNALDRFFPVTEMTIVLDDPASNSITLGQKVSDGMTGSASSANAEIMKKISEIPSKSEVLKEAQDNATQLIHSATNGHVVTTADEQLIMDTDDKETARKVWRWNLNGLGYSNTGYEGQYNTAITMDGQIAGERLVGGSVSAEKLDINYRSEVEKKIELAEENANDATDSKLSSYWTKVEVETAIKNTGDSIVLLAQETATAYTDSKLEGYYNKSQIDVKTDEISIEVSKKLGESEVSSLIEQSAESIRMKATTITWEATNSSLTKDGTFTCKNASISGDISTEKTVSSWKFNSNIGTVQTWYQGTSIERGGFSVKATYSSKCGELTISPAPYELVNSYTNRAYNIINSNRALLIEARVGEASDVQWSGIKFLNGDVEILGGYGSTSRTVLKTSLGSDNSTITGWLNGQWYLPSHLIGCVSDTTTNSPNVWMGSSNSAYLARSSSSSRRYKHDITEIDEELDPECLYNLPVRSFTYNDGYLSKNDRNVGKRMIGFIAEEVESIYPKACQYNENGRVEMWNSQILLPAMMELIKRQHEELILIKERIKSYE